MDKLQQRLGIFKKNRVAVIIIANVILMFLFYLFFSIRAYGGVDEWNADYLLFTIEGRDIANGNLTLQGWWGGDNTFYFLGMIYALFGGLFGFSTKLMSVISAILFSLIVILLDLTIYEFEKSDRQKIGKILFFNAWLLVTFYADGTAQNGLRDGRGIFAGIHLDAALVDMYLFYLVAKVTSGKLRKKWYYAIYVLCFFAFLSDGLAVLYSIVPFCLVLALNFLQNNEWERKRMLVLHFGILILTYVAAFVLLKVWHGINNPRSLSIGLINYDSFFEKISYSIDEILYLFGGDFFGKGLGRAFGLKQSIYSLFSIMMACIMAFFLFAVLKSIKQLQHDYLSQFCLAVDIVFLIIFKFTTYTRTSISIRFNSRLCHIFVIATLILFSRVDLDWIFKKTTLKPHILNILGAALICCFICKAFTTVPATEEPVTKFLDAANYLKEKGLKCGCASYWEYSPMMVASNFDIDYVCVGQGRTDPYHLVDDNVYIKKWQCKVLENTGDVRFAVFKDGEWDGVSSEQLIRLAGEPIEIQQFDDIYVYVWDKDISHCLLEMN